MSEHSKLGVLFVQVSHAISLSVVYSLQASHLTLQSLKLFQIALLLVLVEFRLSVQLSLQRLYLGFGHLFVFFDRPIQFFALKIERLLGITQLAQLPECLAVVL